MPWSGIVRLECSADLPAGEVIRLADLTARLLPPLASSPHKDPRRGHLASAREDTFLSAR